MSKDTAPVLTPEHFAHIEGEDPAWWPARFEPGTNLKVVIPGEGIWATVVEDNGDTIKATLANQPFGFDANFGDMVEFLRTNVRDVILP